MIKLNRPKKPSVLAQNEYFWLCNLKTAIAAYGSYTVIPKDEKAKLVSHYRHADIKRILFESSSQKCAFCESKPSESGYLEVEHFKPKSLYPDFTFDWLNFLPCCRKCNGNKSDHDTVSDPILNPYDNDPHEAFSYNGIRITAQSGDVEDIAKKTIEICGLNGARLMRPRADVLITLHGFSDSIIEAIDDFNLANTDAKKQNRVRKINQALEQIELLIEDSERHSGFCKSFLDSCISYQKAKKIVGNVAA